jgi:hypothetical protein
MFTTVFLYQLQSSKISQSVSLKHFSQVNLTFKSKVIAYPSEAHTIVYYMSRLLI